MVCRTRSRELFVLFLATWCLGLAAVTAHLGLSLALGAFLAGIMLADSDHHSQAASEVEPFRDAFAILFFRKGLYSDAGRFLGIGLAGEDGTVVPKRMMSAVAGGAESAVSP